MSIPIEALESELLRLPVAERTRLLDRVVASLHIDADRDRAWDELAALRDSEIADGSASEISGPEFVALVRAELA